MSKKIGEIKQEFEQTAMENWAPLFEVYEKDGRAGVVSLLAKFRKQEEKLEAERKRMEDMYIYERKYSDFYGYCS